MVRGNLFRSRLLLQRVTVVVEATYAALLAVIAAELAIFAIVASSKERYDRLQAKGVTVSPFMILVDMGKVPRLRRLTESPITRNLLFAFGIINFVALIGLFYWQVLPSLYNIFKTVMYGGGQATSPFVPVIPGVTINIQAFLYIIMALSIGVAAHELFHAIAAYAVGWRVEAWGVGLFLIFPVAYVKPSEEDFKKSSLKAKTTVLAAGVLANTLLFLIALPLLPVVTAQISTVPVIIGVDTSSPDTPAVVAGIKAPAVIVNINGTRINSISDLQRYLGPLMNESVVLDFKLAPARIVGETVLYNASNITVYRVLKPAGSLIGIYISDLPTAGTNPLAIHAARFIYWLEIVNISLGLINAAPLYISDGGRLLSELVKEKAHPAVNHVIQGGTVLAIVVLLVVGFLRFI